MLYTLCDAAVASPDVLIRSDVRKKKKGNSSGEEKRGGWKENKGTKERCEEWETEIDREDQWEREGFSL